jgi:hypothetical protein
LIDEARPVSKTFGLEVPTLESLLAASGNAHLQLGIKLATTAPRYLRSTLAAFSDHQSIVSWYTRNDGTHEALECLTDTAFKAADGVKTNVGIVTLPDGNQVACFCTLQRFSDSEWFVFWVTMDGLLAIYPVEYPALYSLAFQDPLISWLIDLGQWAYQHAPFEYAAIGWELGEDEWEVSSVPERRTAAYLWPDGSGKLVRHLPNA